MLKRLSADERQKGFLARLSYTLSGDIVKKIEYELSAIVLALRRMKFSRSMFEVSATEVQSLSDLIKQEPFYFHHPDDLEIATKIIFLYYSWLSCSWYENENQVQKAIMEIERFYRRDKNESLPFSKNKGIQISQGRKEIKSPVTQMKPAMYRHYTGSASERSSHKTSAKPKKRQQYYKPNKNKKRDDRRLQQALVQSVTISSNNDPLKDKKETKISETEIILHTIQTRAPGMAYTINYIRNIQPARSGEKRILLHDLKENKREAYERLVEIYMVQALRVAMKMADKHHADLEEVIGISFQALSEFFLDYEGDLDDLNWFRLKLERVIERKIVPEWMYFPVEIYNEQYDMEIIHDYLEDRDIDGERFAELSAEDADRLSEIVKRKTKIPDVLESLQKQTVEYLSAYVSRAEFARKFRTSEYYLQKSFGYQPPNVEREWLLEKFHHLSLLDYLENPESMTDTSEELLFIKHAFSLVTPREAIVLAGRTGLDGNPPKTYEEIGRILNLTRERVRQLQERAINKIHNRFRYEKKRDFQFDSETDEERFMEQLVFALDMLKTKRVSHDQYHKMLKSEEFLPNGKRPESRKYESKKKRNAKKPVKISASTKTKKQGPNSLLSEEFRSRFIKPAPPPKHEDPISDEQYRNALIEWLEEHRGMHTTDELIKEIPIMKDINRVRLSRILIALQDEGLIRRTFAPGMFSNGVKVYVSII